MMKKKLTRLLMCLAGCKMDNEDLLLLENWKQHAVEKSQFARNLQHENEELNQLDAREIRP